MLYSGFIILPRSVFWSASLNGRSDNTDVITLRHMDDELIIEHTRSTRTEASRALVGFALSITGLVIIFAVLARIASLSWLEISIISLVILAVAAVALAYCYVNYRSSDNFHLVLTENRVQCFCPIPSCGDSFNLKPHEIELIEIEEWGDSNRYYLRDINGNRHWLTGNYGNPINEIIGTLKLLNPKIQTKDA